MTVKGCRKLCVSSAVDGTDDGMLWNYSEEDGNVRSVWKIKAPTVSDGDSNTDW